tara:strand:+ start:128 stop:1063 length:936 start_codon:yes stop_codon:yes gene_type:complete
MMLYENVLIESLRESILSGNKIRTKIIRAILVALREHEKIIKRNLHSDLGADLKRFDLIVNKLINESLDEKKMYLINNENIDRNPYRDDEIKILSEFTSSPPSENENQDSISGTCFIINNEGIVLTNAHVVGSCKEMTVVRKGEEYKARVIATDNANDLAILKTDLKNLSHFNFSSKDPVRLSEITALGFGFGKKFSSDVKATRGIVSSLSGIANNYSQFQIDASIQVGNSGGPILNKETVIGVAVAKLDTEAAYKESGTIAENVNFAIKISTVRQFLDSNDIDYNLDDSLENQEIDTNRTIDSSVLFIYS